MALYTYYGLMADAVTFFSHRLHADAWDGASATDRENAMIQATAIIDRLNFKGEKASVYAILYDADGDLQDVTDAEIRAAYALQDLDFPRGTDTLVPQDIKVACWECAYALLDGVDPDMELENMGVSSQTYAAVRTSYNREAAPIEHLINGIPSANAWRYLKPFLRDERGMKLSRIN